MHTNRIRIVCAGVVIILLTIIMTETKAACRIPTFMNSTTNVPEGSTFYNATMVMVTCYEGSALKAPGTGVTYNRTCINNKWMPEYECMPVMCPKFPQLANANNFILTTNSQLGDYFKYKAMAFVYCSPGYQTPGGAISYVSECQSHSRWSHQIPCSDGAAMKMDNYLTYNIAGTLMNIPYKEDYGDSQSQLYKDFVESFKRALIQPMTAQFATMYTGARDFELSSEDQGQKTHISFNALFLPTLQYDEDSVKMETTEAFSRQKFILIDPTTNVEYIYTGGLQVSGGKTPLFYITDAAIVALSVEGSLVGLLGIALIATCIVCRNKPFVQRYISREGRKKRY